MALNSYEMLKWNAFKLEYITLTRLFWAEQRTLSPPHPPPLISLLLLLCCLEKQGKHQTTAVNISTRISFVSRADHDQTKHQSGQCNGCHLHRRCNTKSEIRQNGPNRTMQWPSPPPVLQHKVKSEIRQNGPNRTMQWPSPPPVLQHKGPEKGTRHNAMTKARVQQVRNDNAAGSVPCG